MPMVTAIALDMLIEPGASKSVDKPASRSRHPPNPKPVPTPKLHRRNSISAGDKKVQRPPINPELYAIPKATPLPDSPTSFTPSPYVVNHKRRGPRLSKSVSEIDVVDCRKELDNQESCSSEKAVESEVVSSSKEDSTTNNVSSPHEKKEKNTNVVLDSTVGSSKALQKSSDEKLLGTNLRRVMTAVRLMNGKVNSALAVEGESAKNTPQSSKRDGENDDFFDAWDELSSDEARQSYIHEVEAELREMRLSLLMEIRNRKQAEEVLDNMRGQWEKIREQLLHVGLTLPTYPTIEVDESVDSDSLEELCQQVTLIRYVSESIGRGIAKAEVEAEMEAQTELKNFEIARLLDRLHYYEAVNQEMSHRNREAIELARQNRQKRKRRQRWIWGSVVAAITIGTTALLWSYVPAGKGSSSTSNHSSPEHDDSFK